MGAAERLVHEQYRPRRETQPEQPVAQLVPVLVHERCFQLRPHRRAVVQPVPVGEEAWIGGQFGLADSRAELAELAVIAGRHEYLAGRGAQLFVGRQIRMRIAGRHRAAPVQEVVGRLGMQQRHAAIMQRHVEELAEPRVGPLVQRHQHGDGGI